jgi:hypothetical protein
MPASRSTRKWCDKVDLATVVATAPQAFSQAELDKQRT